MKSIKQALITAILLGTSMTVLAGQWQLGVAAEGIRTPIKQADTERNMVPMFNYIGERFSFVGGEFTYQLLSDKSYQLNLLGSPRDQGYDAKDSPILAGMEEREASFDMGLRVATGGLWGVLQLQIISDISGVHEGSETALSYRYPWQSGRWLFEPSVGLSHQSEELVDYYYGIKVTEATADREAHQGRKASNAYAEFTAAYKIDRKWMVVSGFKAESLDQAIVNSPIVESDYTISAFGALLYSF